VALLNEYKLYTVIDQYIYTLPSYLKIQYIENVYVSDDTYDEVDEETVWTEYFYQRPNEELSGNKYFDVLGSLGISPTPEAANLVISITMKKKPDALDSTDLSAAFDFDDELAHILKYECMQIIAESPPYESAARAMYFKGKADEVMDLILERELKYKIKMNDRPKANAWWHRTKEED
jgi:hypothetical protein